MAAEGYVLLPERGVLAISGAEAEPFLQGLISNDLAKITEDRAGYGALLTPQGKFLFDFVILRQGDLVLLDVERERLAAMLQRLTLYRLRAKVTLEDSSGRFAVAAAVGDGVAARFDLPVVARLISATIQRVVAERA